MTRRSSHGDGWRGVGGDGHGRTVASAPPCSTTSSPNSSRSHRHAFEAALLQRQAVEERFQVDVFLGDVSFETSYSLPGEERPARDPGRHQPRLAHLEPDRLPELVHRRGARRAARGAGRDRLPGPGPGRRARAGPARRGAARRASRSSATSPWCRGSTTIEQVHRAADRRAARVRGGGLLRGVVPARRGRPGRPGQPRRRPSPRWAGRWRRCWCASATCPSSSARSASADPGLTRHWPASAEVSLRPEPGVDGQRPEVGLGPGPDVGDDLGRADATEAGRCPRAPARG